MPVGRPTDYDEELARKICDAVAAHGQGLEKLSDMFDWMPSAWTINSWCNKYTQFSQMFDEAKKRQTHALAFSALDEVQKIEKYYYEDPKTGAVCVDSGVVAAQKAIAAQKMWQAARLNPRDYADKKQDDSQNPQETLNKIQSLVADLNKTNVSDI